MELTTIFDMLPVDFWSAGTLSISADGVTVHHQRLSKPLSSLTAAKGSKLPPAQALESIVSDAEETVSRFPSEKNPVRCRFLYTSQIHTHTHMDSYCEIHQAATRSSINRSEIVTIYSTQKVKANVRE